MIHSYDMTVALAEQRRSQLEAEAARRRLVQDARRARRTGAHPIAHHLRARALGVLTRLEVRLSEMRRRAATNTEAPLQGCPTADVVDLTPIGAAEHFEGADGIHLVETVVDDEVDQHRSTAALAQRSRSGCCRITSPI